MKADDSKEFFLYMIKKVPDQINNGDLSVIRIYQIPEGRTILPGVWQMKRKRDIKTHKIENCNPRLNVDRSMMK